MSGSVTMTKTRTCFKSLAVPHRPLCRKFVNQLDDADQSFKLTRLAKYLRDASFPLPDSESESESDVSSISSISSISSLSSSDLIEFNYSNVQAEINELRNEIQEEVNEFLREIQTEANKYQPEILIPRLLRRNPGAHYTPHHCPQVPPTETMATSAKVAAHSTVDTASDRGPTELSSVPAPRKQPVRAEVVDDATVNVGQRQKKRKWKGGTGGERSEPENGRAGKRLRSKKNLGES